MDACLAWVLFIVIPIGLLVFKVWLMIKHPEVNRRIEQRFQARKRAAYGKALRWGVRRWLR